MNTAKPNILYLISILPISILTSLDRKFNSKLLKYCIKYHENLSNLDDDFFIKAIYGDSKDKSNRNKYRGIKSTLKDRLEQELASIQVENTSLFRRQLLLSYLKNIKDAQYFFYYIELYIKELEGRTKKDLEDYHMLATWYMEIHYHPDYDKFSNSSMYLEKSVSFQRKHFLLIEIRNLSEHLGHCLTKKDKNWSLTEVDNAIDKTASFKEPTFEAYCELMMLQKYSLLILKNELNRFEHTHLATLEDILLNKNSTIADFDLQLLCNKFIHILNFSYERYDYENEEMLLSKVYIQKIFLLYKLLEKKGLLTYFNRLSYSNYVSITIVSASLGEFDWCKEFHEKYSNQINPEYREQAISWSELYFLFHKKEYLKTYALLGKLNVNLLFLKNHFRLFEIFILYELYVNNHITHEDVIKRIQPARYHFQRDKVTDQTRVKAFKNTVLFIEKLLNANDNPNFNVSDKVRLKRSLIKKVPILSKPWLFEKLEDIEV